MTQDGNRVIWGRPAVLARMLRLAAPKAQAREYVRPSDGGNTDATVHSFNSVAASAPQCADPTWRAANHRNGILQETAFCDHDGALSKQEARDTDGQKMEQVPGTVLNMHMRDIGYRP